MWPMPKLKKREPLDRVAFFGPMAVGKTWCATVAGHWGEAKVISFASVLKSIAYELYGYTTDKKNEYRELLQQLGDDFRRYDPDVFIKYALKEIEQIEKYTRIPPRILIDDLRYPNESEILKKNGFTLIRVECSEDIRTVRLSTLYPNVAPRAILHASERSYEAIEPDYTVTSDGVDTFLALGKIFGENSNHWNKSQS